MSVLVLFSPYLSVCNIYFVIGSRILPFGKEPFTSECNMSIYNFSDFPFRFRGHDIGSVCTSSCSLFIFYFAYNFMGFLSFSKRYITLDFCTKRYQHMPGTAPQWTAGKYCLLKTSSACPTGNS